MKTIVLTMIITISTFVSSQQRYCGKNLAETMRLVCDAMEPEKRSEHSKHRFVTLQDLEDGYEGSRLTLKDLFSKGPRTDMMRSNLLDGYPASSEGHGVYGGLSKNSGLEASGWAWIAPRQARALETVRGKRQIVEECCHKGCSIDEMMTYC